MSDIEFYEKQLSKARGEGNRHMMGAHLSSLGNMYAGQGDTRKGIQYLEEAYKIRWDLKEWDDVALTCKNLAGCYELGLSDLATAVRYLETAAKVASPNNPQKKTYEAMAAARREELQKK